MTTPLSPLELLLAILSLAAATLATRSGVLVAGERLVLSHRVEAALRFAPACALTALILLCQGLCRGRGAHNGHSVNGRRPAIIVYRQAP